jgi:hypothetical protein
MNQNKNDDVEYQRRVQQLMSFWGLSEVAILMHARRNHVDIAQQPWDIAFERLTRKYVDTVDVKTRQVGKGYLGKEYAPGQAHETPTNITRLTIVAPTEPNAQQLFWWNQRIKFETTLSKVFGREVKFPFPLWW